ncbi:hypothetical protein AX16_005031 [Volvariella volvacea WC 439]|nr:hypothetical protein AX16_005031 [Volvariella volvacea WC 439]
MTDDTVYIPSEQHVKSVRYLLQYFLPLELVDLIIEDAEYWPRLHSERSERITVAAADEIPSLKSVWCYLVSPPVPDPIQALGESKTRRIEFKVQSHDQGWATHPGPWSWFEAVIIPAPGKTTPDWLSAALRDPINLRTHSKGAAFDQLFEDPQNTMRWHIASNPIAVWEMQDHSVVWTQQEIKGHQDANSLKGREGLGHELVRALQPGDRVAVLALAEQWGWENHVYSGSIDIYYSV